MYFSYICFFYLLFLSSVHCFVCLLSVNLPVAICLQEPTFLRDHLKYSDDYNYTAFPVGNRITQWCCPSFCPSVRSFRAHAGSLEDLRNFKFGGNIFPRSCNWHPIFGHKGQRSKVTLSGWIVKRCHIVSFHSVRLSHAQCIVVLRAANATTHCCCVSRPSCLCDEKRVSIADVATYDAHQQRERYIVDVILPKILYSPQPFQCAKLCRLLMSV